MERLIIDLIDMKRNKNQKKSNAWILTIIDVYSKSAWAFFLVKKFSIEVSKNLESLFYTNTNPPIIIQSDSEKEFINKEMSALCERFLIVFKHYRPIYSLANSQIVRFNQTLTRYLQKHIFEDEANEKPLTSCG
ncbi:putative uncharacterized transposon-derived protein F54H12.3 [Cucumispora dikerogammari]|nr:putative uncharacterized transposon-derived protein F54H12.3 [Cucumispora dikerogammari]